MLHVLAHVMFKGLRVVKSLSHVARHAHAAKHVTAPGTWVHSGETAKHTAEFVVKQAKHGIRFPKV